MLDATLTRSASPHLKLALAVSVLIHILFILSLLRAPLKQTELPQTFEVSYEALRPPQRQPPPEQAPTRQIVTPPPAPEVKPPENTRYLSDRDARVPKEQVKKGDAPDAGPNPMPKTQVVPPAQKVAQAQPALKNLTLDDKTLLEKFSSENPKDQNGELTVAEKKRAKEKPNDLSAYRAFSRPSGSGAAVFGVQGTSDYLPNLPDGDVTLLNAKAERFAVFVRRVALQVFSNIRQSGWETLSPSDIHALSDFTTIEAVLSKTGKLLKVTLEGPSGSNRFDLVIKDSVQHGAVDPNPPPAAAAEDGNIHFIFKARSWSEPSLDGRTGARFERRWLLLSTGLL